MTTYLFFMSLEIDTNGTTLNEKTKTFINRLTDNVTKNGLEWSPLVEAINRWA